MDGITIIQTTAYHSLSLPALLFVIIVISLLCITGIVLLKILADASGKREDKKTAFIFSFVLSVVSIFGIINMVMQYNVIQTRYTVSIDDSVGFNEFYSKYRIIEQSGDHYIVEEIKE